MTARQQSILIGAIVTGVLSTSYLAFINALCCLGVIIGGAVATQQYTSRTRTTVESGDGAVLGALAGVGGAILQPVLNRALRPFGLGLRDITLSMVEGMQGQSGMSPEMMEQMQGGQSMSSLLFSLVVGMVVYAIFGAIGGAIGAAIFGEDEQGQDLQSGGAQPGGPPSEESAPGGTEPGAAQPGSPDSPQDESDESTGGSESNREGSV